MLRATEQQECIVRGIKLMRKMFPFGSITHFGYFGGERLSLYLFVFMNLFTSLLRNFSSFGGATMLHSFEQV